MNDQKALTPQEQTVESLSQELALVRKQSIATLGDGEVFIKRTEGGQIQAVRGGVRLEETNGELAEIQGKVMTTGKGFYKANQIASLSIITPQKMTLPDGSVVVNPFPIIDKESGTIRKIWVKKMAVGYGPIGNLAVTSITLLYDLNMYFIQDLVKKVKASSAAGRICFEAQLTEEEKKTGIFYKIDGSLGVWANVENADILKCIDTFVNKKQFAERNAQTITERLAMAKHPALSHISMVTAAGPGKARVAKVSVIGYVHELTKEQIEDIADGAERDEEVRVGGEVVEVIKDTEEASYDDVATHDDDETALQNAKAMQDAEICDDDVPFPTMPEREKVPVGGSTEEGKKAAEALWNQGGKKF